MEREPKQLRTDKLIDATNLDGEKNEALFRVTEEVDKELSQFPWYIGTTPFGSQTKGYNSETTNSDIDIYVLHKQFQNIDEHNEYWKTTDNLEGKFGSRNQKLHFIEYGYTDPIFDSTSIPALSVLAMTGRGGNVKMWREKARTEFSALEPEIQNNYFQAMLKNLVLEDQASSVKLRQRIPSTDKYEWLNARKKLWEHRLRNIYFENNN